MAKTAVLYARYSSDKQREASIDDQLRACRAYCNVENIEIVREYADHALSGKTDQRPQFRQMVANAPESDYVVVYTFDRFSRDRYDSATYKKMLRECGVRVVSATERVEDTPEGGLQEGLLEILSEYYVADLARKVRRGMEGNALRAMDNGYRIFGYATDPDTRRYVIRDDEAAVVREIFDRYIGGESIYEIARAMAARGWTTTSGRSVDYNWVWRVLTRRAYTGLYSWAGIEVKGGMPVIIDEDTFERAQRVPKRKPREGEVWSTYHLSGKLFCGICGEPMHGYGGTGKSGKRYHYYGCKDKGGCGRRGVRRSLVEGALVDAVLEVTSDEDKMRMVARRVIESYTDEDVRLELEACEARIAELEKERHNLTQAAIKGFVNDEVVARNNAIAAELRELHDRRGVLMSQSFELTEDDIVEFLAHGFDASDEDFIFNTFTRCAYLYDDAMLVVFNFRDEVGDLAETRVSIGEYLAKLAGFARLADGTDEQRKTPAHEGLGCLSRGVPDNVRGELFGVPGGFAMVFSLAA